MSRHSSELGSTTRRYPRLSLRGLMISTSPVAVADVTAAACGGAAPLAGSPGASVSRGLESIAAAAQPPGSPMRLGDRDAWSGSWQRSGAEQSSWASLVWLCSPLSGFGGEGWGLTATCGAGQISDGQIFFIFFIFFFWMVRLAGHMASGVGMDWAGPVGWANLKVHGPRAAACTLHGSRKIRET